VDAVLVSSLTEGAGLPAREAAAAGRLVISTPVGDFPLLTSQGIGIIAPIEARKYKNFVTATLKHYKESPVELVEACHKVQDAARQRDWQYMIDHWIELIETAKAHVLQPSRVLVPLRNQLATKTSAKKLRLIPLSQVDQYLGLAGVKSKRGGVFGS
jgi:hypothetical protein